MSIKTHKGNDKWALFVNKQLFWWSASITLGSIFGKRALLAIDHIMLALFWNYVPNMKLLVDM